MPKTTTAATASTTSAKSGNSSVGWDIPSLVGYTLSHSLFLFGLVTQSVTASTFAITSIFYLFSMLSISAGYHRLWCHRSYTTFLPIKIFFLLFGATAFVGSARNWAHYHRDHHRHIDSDRDPSNVLKGFFWAHIGWRFHKVPLQKEVIVSDLESDSLLTWQSRLYLPIAFLFGIVLPTYLCSLWGDLWGGLYFAAMGRIVLVQHSHFLTQSLCHIIGTQPYSDQFSARNLILVSFLTMGEGYRNFHHQFPQDYRLGPRFYDLDATKWILDLLALFGLVSPLHVTTRPEMLKTKIEMKQRKLDRVKTTVDFGPNPELLPVLSWSQITQRVEKGDQLIVIDGLVHDVSKFLRDHPGGIKIIKTRIGTDCTLAFNGAVYRHTKAARNLSAMMRVAQLPKEEVNTRVESDHTPSEVPEYLLRE